MDHLQELCPQLVTAKTLLAGHFNTIEVADQVNAMIERSWQSGLAGHDPAFECETDTQSSLTDFIGKKDFNGSADTFLSLPAISHTREQTSGPPEASNRGEAVGVRTLSKMKKKMRDAQWQCASLHVHSPSNYLLDGAARHREQHLSMEVDHLTKQLRGQSVVRDVVIADNDPILQQGLAKYLEEHGMSVRCACNRHEIYRLLTMDPESDHLGSAHPRTGRVRSAPRYLLA